MSEKTWERNTAGIAAHAQKRKEQKRQGVEEAIAALLREQRPVNFHTVAVSPHTPPAGRKLSPLRFCQLSARAAATAFPSSAGRFWDEGEQFQADPRKVFGFAGMISTGSGASLDNTMAGSLRIGRRWVASSEL